MKARLSREDEKLLEALLRECQGLIPSTDPARLHRVIQMWRELMNSADPRVQRQAVFADHLHANLTERQFLNFVIPLERLIDRHRADPEILVDETDQTSNEPFLTRPLAFVLDHLRSSFNVGSIYRIAETLAAHEVILTGYTPGPESEGVVKTSMGTLDRVTTRRFEQTEEALTKLRGEGYALVALETQAGAKSLYEGPLPEKCAWVVGNERFGLDHRILKLCDEVRRIPLVGRKNSLNVAAALSVAAFEWHRQRGTS